MDQHSEPNGPDERWSYQILYYALIAGSLFWCLGMYYKTWSEGSNFPVGFAVALILMVTFVICALEMIVKADAGNGHFGGARMVIGLILLYGAASIGNAMLPGKLQNDLRQFASPFQGNTGRKPMLKEAAQPPNPPALRWVKMEFKQAPKSAYVQIRMSVDEARAGFPVLQTVPIGDEAIIGWGKSSDGDNTKTDDL